MNRFVATSLFAVTLAIALGCGGAGGVSFSVADFVGTYQGSFTRAVGGVTVTVNDQNEAIVSIADDSGQAYGITAQITPSGTFSGSDATNTVTVTGALTQNTGTKQVSLTISGAINAIVETNYVSANNLNLFVGNYSGTMIGDRTIPVTMTVTGAGEFNVQGTQDNHSISAQGTLSPAGGFDGSGDMIDAGVEGVQVFIGGVFFKTPTGETKFVGSWRNGLQYKGTWSGTKVQTLQ